MHHFRFLCRFALAAILSVLVFPTLAEARFAVQSNTDSEIQFFNRSVNVNEDGTSIETIKLLVVDEQIAQSRRGRVAKTLLQSPLLS